MIARQWDPAIEFASDARELAVEMLRRAGLEPCLRRPPRFLHLLIVHGAGFSLPIAA